MRRADGQAAALGSPLASRSRFTVRRNADYRRNPCAMAAVTLPRVDILGLRQRNPIAHKRKATFRSLELRETAFWRIHDLLTQAYELHLAHRALGARILLRSAIETLATLIYLNQATAAVLAGEQNFGQDCSIVTWFEEQVDRARSIEHHYDPHKARKGVSRDAGCVRLSIRDRTSELRGMSFGYSRIDRDNHIAEFSNSISAMHEATHLEEMEFVHLDGQSRIQH
jgi:hypothetical protein